MQAAKREGAADIQIGPGLRLELPEPLVERARVVLGPLFELPCHLGSPGLPSLEALSGGSPTMRVEQSADGWWIARDRCRHRAASEDELLLRLQEIGIEIAARRRQWLLFRGSVVSRGSQSVLIVGDEGDAPVLLAVALAALEFRPASVALAAFDGRRLTPLPLPLAFRLGPGEQAALAALPFSLDELMIRLSPDLFRPACVTPAPEPTHVLFPEASAGPFAFVRPISATTARARLCGALLVAPDDPPPFAAVAGLLRPARGVRVFLGDLPHTLEQLARLLPQWRLE